MDESGVAPLDKSDSSELVLLFESVSHNFVASSCKCSSVVALNWAVDSLFDHQSQNSFDTVLKSCCETGLETPDLPLPPCSIPSMD